jgi:hypothetical protein
MALDPRIALGVQPLQIESPINTMSQIAQLRAGQQQEQFNAMRLAQAQRQQQESEQFNALMARGGATPQELIQTGSGRAALKSVGEAFKMEQEGRKEQRLAQQAQLKLGADQLGAVQQAFRGMSALPDTELTRDKVIARLLPLEQIGVPRSVIEATVAQVSDDPAANRREIQAVLQAGMAPKDQSSLTAPKLEPVSVDGRTVMVDMNPNSPTFSQPKLITPSAPFNLSPGQMRVEGGRVVAQAPFAPRPEAMRPEPAPTVTEVTDPTDPNRTLRIDARQYTGGGVGSPGVLGVSRQQEGALTRKEIQKREAARPQATLAFKAVETNSASLIRDLNELYNHPGLEGMTGLIAGRTPNLTGSAREAQALLDYIKAKGTFAVLQAMRDASKTGGALGNVSNFEVKKLEDAFGTLTQTQNTDSVKRALLRIISDTEGASARVREAFDTTYEYRNEEAPAGRSAIDVPDTSSQVTTPEPMRPAQALGDLSPEEQEELLQLRQRLGARR